MRDTLWLAENVSFKWEMKGILAKTAAPLHGKLLMEGTVQVAVCSECAVQGAEWYILKCKDIVSSVWLWTLIVQCDMYCLMYMLVCIQGNIEFVVLGCGLVNNIFGAVYNMKCAVWCTIWSVRCGVHYEVCGVVYNMKYAVWCTIWSMRCGVQY